MQQDVDFAIRQLVDIALRALSAAINAPATATEVVLQLGGLLRRLLATEPAATTDGGEGGKLLLRAWLLSQDEYIDHAFDQIRQACTSQPHVATALARVLRMLIEHVGQIGCAECAVALNAQLRLLVDAIDAEPSVHPQDLSPVPRCGAISDRPRRARHKIAVRPHACPLLRHTVARWRRGRAKAGHGRRDCGALSVAHRRCARHKFNGVS